MGKDNKSFAHIGVRFRRLQEAIIGPSAHHYRVNRFHKAVEPVVGVEERVKPIYAATPVGNQSVCACRYVIAGGYPYLPGFLCLNQGGLLTRLMPSQIRKHSKSLKKPPPEVSDLTHFLGCSLLAGNSAWTGAIVQA
jgi:hypothetical protein